MRCNVAIKDNRLRPCTLEKGHSGPHEYEKDVEVKHRSLKNGATLILGQSGLWGGLAIGFFVFFGIEAYDSGHTFMAILFSFLSFFGVLIGMIHVAEYFDKKWKLEKANLHHNLLPEEQK